MSIDHQISWHMSQFCALRIELMLEPTLFSLAVFFAARVTKRWARSANVARSPKRP